MEYNHPNEYAADIGTPLSQRVAVRQKPVVHFSAIAKCPKAVGGVAHVIPVDHPAVYLNGDVVTTSAIVAVFDDGSFETRNTKYVPLK